MPRCLNPRCQADNPLGTTQCGNPFCRCLLPEMVVAGRYWIESLVGIGGMATVYRVKDVLESSTVALKIFSLNSSNQGETGSFERFYREAYFMYRLRHKGIIPLLNFGRDGNLAYIAMPLITGGTLKSLLKPDLHLPIEQAFHYIRDLSEAIDTVHSHPERIVHCDIKPSNLLIHQDDGRLVLIDFGIAQVAGARDLSPGRALGTEHYIAPELEKGNVEPLSDIYSMGVVAYQLFTGLLPFQAVVRSRAVELPLPSTLNDELPMAVDQVILKAFQIDTRYRFKSGKAFITALSSALNLASRQLLGSLEVTSEPKTKRMSGSLDNRTDLYEYDFAISYAREDGPYVDSLANALNQLSIKVFYDKYEKFNLAGRNLYDTLSEIYERKSRYCIMFLSKHYLSKMWTTHERQSAQARALREKNVYIIPILLDETQLPSSFSTVAYINWHEETPQSIAEGLVRQLKPIVR